MNCPFLQEARVRFCHAAGIRKMLMQPAPAGEERCSSTSYVDCSVYKTRLAPEHPSPSCPFLHEAHVQYCAAASVSKPVPYSESTLMRCGHTGYRYCDSYMAMARTAIQPGDVVEGIELPGQLRYTPNHMWIDLAEDGSWRIGIDALLAHCFGSFDRVTFLTQGGLQRPSAVLTSGATELHITFPHIMPISNCNLYLRADPSRIAASPYAQGWLFCGDKPPDKMGGLISGQDANSWMAGELHAASAFAHAQLDPQMPADGGTPEPGFANLLPREERLRLIEALFSPLAFSPLAERVHHK